MRRSTRYWLLAAICTALACSDEADSDPVPPSSPEGGAPVAAGDAGLALDASGGGPRGAQDGSVVPAPSDAGAPLDAGADARSDADRSDAGRGGDAGRSDAGRGSDGGRADAGRPDARPDGSRNDAGRDAAPSGDEELHATIVVAAGETFDGEGRRFSAGPELGDGSQSETQKPLFKLEDGARLVNVVLGSPAADGIHTHGDVTLENIVWEDVGEDALTIKESGTVVLNGGSAQDGEDKVFQINAASTFRVSDFVARDAGKFIRQNGQTTFKVEVFIDGCDIANMDEAIFRTDSPTSTVNMQNTRYSNIGGPLFMGVAPANVTTANNTEY
jgi:pectate lyase C